MEIMKLKEIRKNKNTASGITLIALVITIIILLILVGVSIATLSGENGVINQASIAKVKSREAEVEEEVNLATNNLMMEIQKQRIDNRGYKATNFVDTNTDGNITVEKSHIELLQTDLTEEEGYTISVTGQEYIGDEIKKELTITFKDSTKLIEDKTFLLILTGNTVELSKKETVIEEEDTDYDELPEDFWLADEETGTAYINKKYLAEEGYNYDAYSAYGNSSSGLEDFTGTNEYSDYGEIMAFRESDAIPTAGFNSEYTKLVVPSEAAIMNEDGTLRMVPVTKVNFFRVLNIQKVKLPDTITEFPNLMYSKASIEKVIMGDGIKHLDKYACAYFTKLTYAKLPEKLNNTELSYIFYGCENLTKVSHIPEGIELLQHTFYGCKKLIEVPKIPNSVTRMYHTFEDCTSLVKSPVIPNNVTEMFAVFRDCISLTQPPVIPDSVVEMASTFEWCENLTQAPVLPKNVTDISSTFRGCESLTQAPVLPNSVTDMACTFSHCINITKAPAIPSSVTSLHQTFYGCTNLEGDIEINANPEEYDTCFYETVKPIKIIGSTTLKAALATTTNNRNVTY